MTDERVWPGPCQVCGETRRILTYETVPEQGNYHSWVECLQCRTRGAPAAHHLVAVINWNAGRKWSAEYDQERER